MSGLSVAITTSGINAVGQTYRLECSANSPTNQPSVNWLHNGGGITGSDAIRLSSSIFVNPIDGSTSSTYTLTFSPLAASHAGNYTCRVTAGEVTETRTTTVIVNSKLGYHYYNYVYSCLSVRC